MVLIVCMCADVWNKQLEAGIEDDCSKQRNQGVCTWCDKFGMDTEELADLILSCSGCTADTAWLADKSSNRSCTIST